MNPLYRFLPIAAGAIVIAAASAPRASRIACAPDNGGITLPDGFCASVFADSLPGPRHIAVASNGDVFVNVGGRTGRPGGIVVLRDTNGDGRADIVHRFADSGNTEIAIANGHVYASEKTSIVRYPMRVGDLDPTGPRQVIVADLPKEGHTAHTFVVDGRNLYVNVGSGTNSCQANDRRKESPGRDPCTELESRAGIWLFDATKANQTRTLATRYATGIRNSVAIAMNPADHGLYAVFHGRDQLFDNWPAHFTAEQSAELPAEEFIHITKGADFGWPYCYYDQLQKHLVLAPEYGGDGKQVGRCAQKQEPLMGFPGHWAPDGLLFYSGSMFPAPYRGGAFIAFHGSWNRSPLPQAGYRVVFQPMQNGKPSGEYTTFAGGFAPEAALAAQRPANIRRPVGLALAPDGSVYITDDATGRIWKVVYQGR